MGQIGRKDERGKIPEGPRTDTDTNGQDLILTSPTTVHTEEKKELKQNQSLFWIFLGKEKSVLGPVGTFVYVCMCVWESRRSRKGKKLN